MRDYNFKFKDFEPFLPLRAEKLEKFPLEVHYLVITLNGYLKKHFTMLLKIVILDPGLFEQKGLTQNIIA